MGNTMDNWHLLNGVVSIMGVFALSWVVLHPKIHEGVVIKLGLVMMIFSLAATAILTLTETENWTALWRAGFALRLGLFLAGCGVIWRAYGMYWSGRLPKRRATDWAKFK
jgi:hypothetical protein